MIFRPVRELLSEALAAKVEITTWEELIAQVDAPYCEHPLKITWRYQGFDNRIESDSLCSMC